MLHVTVILILLLVVTNVYWYRRLKATEQSLIASRDAERLTERTMDDRHDRRLLNKAAEAASVAPEEVPAKIETLQADIRSQKKSLEELRGRWAQSYWKALKKDPDFSAGIWTVVINLERGTLADAKEFANFAQNIDQAIMIVIANSDDGFAVGLGDDAAESFSAESVAQDIASSVGGGGGGNRQFATGGGGTAEAIQKAAEKKSNRFGQS